MAGNSQRRGAMRKTARKKGAVVGSGGQRSKGLEGKGPTPKAEERHRAPGAAQGQRRAPRGKDDRQKRPSAGNARRDGRRPQPGRRVPAGRRAGHGAVRGDRHRHRRAGGRGGPAGRRPGHLGAGGAARRAGPDHHRRHAPGPRRCRCRRSSTPTRTSCSPRPRTRGEPPLLVALDGVTDPRNLGAVVRSAAAFGAHGVLLPQRRSAGMTAVAWRTSAGTAARMPVAMATNLTRTLRDWAERGAHGRRPGRRRDDRRRRARAGHRPAGGRGRLRGPGAVPTGEADVRRDRVDPDGRGRRVAQRVGGRRRGAGRGGPAPSGRPAGSDVRPIGLSVLG